MGSLPLIGVPAIDQEHHALVLQLDRLNRDLHAHPDSEAFSYIFSRLGQQMSAHFDSEEDILASCGMPAAEVATHVRAHTAIMDQYTRINLDLMEGKAITRLEALQLIGNWIVGHVERHDIAITKYLPAGSSP